MNRPQGMHPAAFKSWISACYEARINPSIITQTMGVSVQASAGSPARDGAFTVDGVEHGYSVAFDISVRTLVDSQIESLLSACYKNLIVGWHRRPPTWRGSPHCHLFYVSLPMKEFLQKQFQDWLHDRDGLAKHSWEVHAPCSAATKARIAAAFFAANPP